MSRFIPTIGSMNRLILWLMAFCAMTGFGAEISQKVLICGVCRNVESRLEKTIEIMESIGSLFEEYRILVYENNSMDCTAQILAKWASENPRVWVKSETLSRTELEGTIININRDGSFFVPEQIARARNIVLDEAFKEDYREFPYLIWMDMDFVLSPDYEGFIDTFQNPREWDAVFAYGVDPQNIYWDWYAFRDVNYPLGSELLGMDWWYMRKDFSLKSDAGWHPVYSAFGGCGIYKKDAIQGCRYAAIVTEDLEQHCGQLVRAGSVTRDPQVLKYLRLNAKLKKTCKIDSPMPHLPPVPSPAAGIIVHDRADALVWRMSTFVYQYPSVCEHVPFHASMIVRGHDKLFINPKLVFRYGG